MAQSKEWQSFLRRILAEFSIQKYSVYDGNGSDMKLYCGVSLPELLIERYLSFRCTMVSEESDGNRLITQVWVQNTVYLLVLYSKDALSENDVCYILNDIVQLQKQLTESAERSLHEYSAAHRK